MTARILATILASAIPAFCWHVPAHQKVTRAAIQSLPPEMQQRWAPIAKDIVGQYCLLPDTFRGGQVDRDEFRVYCLKPDGKAIHNVQWKRDEDIASLTYLLDNLVAAIHAHNDIATARYAGVLAHLLGDSTCPAHAFMPADSPLTFLTDMLPPPPSPKKVDYHTVIERDTPDFDLGARKPQSAGATTAAAAASLLDRTYAAVKANRAYSIELLKAVYANDEAVVNRIRAVGARAGAELLADAYYTAFSLADSR